mmetsp:Transcript_14962/g.28153  ORF Transcript_14962/g.28153 Transcript_14962/m.28153 type:complete len:262 (+) Transcript_14962:1283-2068(+)
MSPNTRHLPIIWLLHLLLIGPCSNLPTLQIYHLPFNSIRYATSLQLSKQGKKLNTKHVLILIGSCISIILLMVSNNPWIVTTKKSKKRVPTNSLEERLCNALMLIDGRKPSLNNLTLMSVIKCMVSHVLAQNMASFYDQCGLMPIKGKDMTPRLDNVWMDDHYVITNGEELNPSTQLVSPKLERRFSSRHVHWRIISFTILMLLMLLDKQVPYSTLYISTLTYNICAGHMNSFGRKSPCSGSVLHALNMRRKSSIKRLTER